jgi:endonuclease G
MVLINGEKEMKLKYIYSVLLLLFVSFTISAQTSNQLVLGNPSEAETDLNESNNYLVTHADYILSYNNDRGAANWVFWHLESSDIGKAERTNAFAPDTTLPKEWWVLPTAYSGSGYDRGHLCPSKDRSDTEERNKQTFLMSNMQPQVPKLNQQTWKYLEDYTREIVGKDNEAYIYAGCYGVNGKIKDKITIPTNCYKIIVVLPVGDDDLKRVDNTTRVIAVNMPNDATISERWRTYLTTVDDIEAKTGYDFLSEVSKKIQKSIESKIDEQNTDAKTTDTKTTDNKDTKQTTADSSKQNTKNGRTYILGPRGGCYYLDEKGEKKYEKDKSKCANLTIKSADKTSETNKSSTDKKEEKTEEKPATPKKSSDGRTYILGPNGGCYYLTESGKKKYEKDKSKCANLPKTSTETDKEDEKSKEETQTPKTETQSTTPKENKDGRTYIKGSRGGCYYLDENGKKVYMRDKSLCN